MNRPVFDRWTDTTAFRLALLFAALAVVPMLLLGIATTVIGGAVMLGGPSMEVELEQVAFALLSLGGALGFVGYLRAHWGARNPDRHNVTATLLCLAAGVATALAVAGYTILETLDGLRALSGSRWWVSLTALFAAANLVWALSGIAWMRRLPRRYAERTGLAFDGLPTLLLFVAVALATAATTITITL